MYILLNFFHIFYVLEPKMQDVPLVTWRSARAVNAKCIVLPSDPPWTFSNQVKSCIKPGIFRAHMLEFEQRFDLQSDVVSDILKKEASVCELTEGEAFRCPWQHGF